MKTKKGRRVCKRVSANLRPLSIYFAKIKKRRVLVSALSGAARKWRRGLPRSPALPTTCTGQAHVFLLNVIFIEEMK